MSASNPAFVRVLYLDIDSLRPDHLGCYGYHRDTSPNIDAIAAEGIRFTNHYASDAPCLPSRTALFTGRFGASTGVINHGGVFSDMKPQGVDRQFRAAPSLNTLGAKLRDAGMRTVSISPFPSRHSAYQVVHGFHETIDTGRNGMDDAHEVWPSVEKWLDSNAAEEGWFLHVNLWDPHTPYDHPEEYGNPFEGDPIDEWLTQDVIDAQNKSFGPHSATEVPGYTEEAYGKWRMGVTSVKNLDDAKAHMDGYDTGIHYADHFVGKMVDKLKAMGLYEDTAIIVSADHGENHGELNVWGDHQTADQFCNRIPLIVRWPGLTDAKAGSEHHGLHYNLDLAPTLVGLAGGDCPEIWDGESFADEMLDPESGRPFLVISQGAWSCQRAVRWDNWIMIRTYHTGLKHFPAYMLFDLENDPHEQNNLAAERPDLVAHATLLLDQWVADRMEGADRGDPMWGVVAEGGPHHANVNADHWDKYVARLEATGRGEHAANLKKHGGKPFVSGLE